MTKIEFKKASGPLSEYATKARKGPVVVYKAGKPFAAVIPIRNADEETLALSTNRKFLKIIETSRGRVKKEGAILGSRTAPAPGFGEVDSHFDVSRILETWKFPVLPRSDNGLNDLTWFFRRLSNRLLTPHGYFNSFRHCPLLDIHSRREWLSYAKGESCNGAQEVEGRATRFWMWHRLRFQFVSETKLG